MAGYSATPLARKLGIESGPVVALLDAPPGFEESLAPLPPETDVRNSLDCGPFDVGSGDRSGWNAHDPAGQVEYELQCKSPGEG